MLAGMPSRMVTWQDHRGSTLLISMDQDSLKTALIPPKRHTLETQLLAMGPHLPAPPWVTSVPTKKPWGHTQLYLSHGWLLSVGAIVPAGPRCSRERIWESVDCHNDPLSVLQSQAEHCSLRGLCSSPQPTWGPSREVTEKLSHWK